MGSAMRSFDFKEIPFHEVITEKGKIVPDERQRQFTTRGQSMKRMLSRRPR